MFLLLKTTCLLIKEFAISSKAIYIRLRECFRNRATVPAMGPKSNSRACDVTFKN